MKSCCEEIKDDVVPQEAPPKKGFMVWLKRIGIAGFLFFLLKGLAWMFFGAAILKACKR